MGARRLTNTDFDRICAMREAGKSYEQIGRVIGCSAKAVSWHCLRLGAEGPKQTKLWDGIVGPETFSRNGHIVRRYTPDDDALLLALECQGIPINAIARRMGRRANSVRGRLMTLARREERAKP
jgi:hypothetical protein